MRFDILRLRALWLASATLLLGGSVTRAAYIINVQQAGSDVVATGSGSIDTTNLAFVGSESTINFLEPNKADVSVGTSTTNDFYRGTFGPKSFGTGALIDASSDLGSLVGVSGDASTILVPTGYVSQTPLGVSTATFSNQTIAGLGLNPGTYNYTWGTGPDADSFTVQIAPEPGSLSLLAIGGLAMVGRRRVWGGTRVVK